MSKQLKPEKNTHIQKQQASSYPLTIQKPVKNPAQEDDDSIRMATMLIRLMGQNDSCT